MFLPKTKLDAQVTCLPSNQRGVLVDSSLGGNNGSFYGTPALSFDGITDVADIASPFDWYGGHSHALVACAFRPDSSDPGWLFNSESANTRLRIALNSGVLFVGVTAASGQSEVTATSTFSYTADAWHYLLVGVDLPNNLVHFALNGEFESVELSASAGARVFDSETPTAIQWGSAGSGYRFGGKLNKLAFLGRDTGIDVRDSEKFHNFPFAWCLENIPAGCDGDWWPFSERTGNLAGIANGYELAHGGTSFDFGSNGGDGFREDSFDLTVRGKRFNGRDDGIHVSDAENLRFGTGDFQILGWFNADSELSEMSPILSKGGFGGWMLYLGSSGNLGFLGDGGNVSLSSEAAYFDDTDHFFAVIGHVDSGTLTVKLYIDSTEIGSDTVASWTSGSGFDHEGTLYIGSDAGSNRFQGYIPRVVIATSSMNLTTAFNYAEAIRARGPHLP